MVHSVLLFCSHQVYPNQRLDAIRAIKQFGESAARRDDLRGEMTNYFKAFILLCAVGNIFAIPLYVGSLVYLRISIAGDRWPRIMLVYVLVLVAVSAILWFQRKMIPDGSTKNGKNAYHRTAIALFLILGISAFHALTNGAEANTIEVAKKISYAISMPIGAAVLVWLSPKLRARAGRKSGA